VLTPPALLLTNDWEPNQESIPDDREALDKFLRTEISAVDVAKDLILGRLKDEVRANHDALIEGMKVVQEVDLDIVRAQIHVKNGRRLLDTAKNDMLMRFVASFVVEKFSGLTCYGRQLAGDCQDEAEPRSCPRGINFV